ncbi:MAG TPA: glycosyltransferase family 4 protein [Chloroflexi bacterium]|nr:glycosyltransferase family 4 protein [Chloroflexota bacterium]
MRVAIIHDWLNQYGGAEIVLEALKEMFPEAPIYTSMYWPQAMPDFYRGWDIRTSFMDKLPFVKTHHQPFLPLYPLAFEGFDLSGYDVVISNKSGFCHGVITPSETIHICYCLTPTRFVWNYHGYIRREGLGRVARWLLPLFLNYLRTWDRLAADRVDFFVAISQEVKKRIAKYYKRESEVIYPPVYTDRFQPSPEQDDYFLVVSRLIPYKRIDIAVEAFNRLGLPLLIVGEGRDRKALEAMAEPNVRFLGRVSGGELARLYARCQALIFPGREDFGIAPVEAQAAGRPVIAYAAGGALDTVIECETGLFFYEQTPEALSETVREFMRYSDAFDPEVIRANALRFDVSRFKERMQGLVKMALHSLPERYEMVTARLKQKRKKWREL